MTLCLSNEMEHSKCFYMYPLLNASESWGGWNQLKSSNMILIVQHFALTITVLHFGKYLIFHHLKLIIFKSHLCHRTNSS